MWQTHDYKMSQNTTCTVSAYKIKTRNTAITRKVKGMLNYLRQFSDYGGFWRATKQVAFEVSGYT